FEEFEREAERGNVVPVVRSVLADLQTPVGAFLRIADDAQYAFLLESIEGGERVARYSFLGANPWMIVRGHGAETIVEESGVGDRARLRELYDAAVAETEKIEKKLYEEMTVASDARPRSGDTTVHFQSNWPRKEFEAAVNSVKEHIAAGDCYQVVIAQQFTKP